MALPGSARATILALAVAAAARPAHAEPRYWALFRDGAQVTAEMFSTGTSWDNETVLADRRLFDPANPIRVLCDTTLKSSPPEAYVQMANGDVVPGTVRRWLPGSPQDGLPERLLLVPRGTLRTPDPNGLAVRADRVWWIVSGRPAAAECEPAALVLADGKTAVAAALRWTEEGVRVLTADGIVTARFAQIAELRVSKVNLLDAVLDDARYPPLEGESLIGRLETVDGAVLTYRRTMTRVALDRSIQQPARSSRTPPPRQIYLQPSWSLSPLILPADAVCRRSYRTADEVPLSLLPAQLTATQRGLHYWPWQRNRNVLGEPLQSGQMTVALGLGTHSHSEIAFEMPPEARLFRTIVGLDDRTGDGGCAKVVIYRNDTSGEPLYASGFLQGASDPLRVGPLDVRGAERLVLVTEFAHDGRPAGADPFDVRDHVDWLLPMLSIERPGGDPQQRQEMVCRFVPGWKGWTPADALTERLALSATWDEALSRWVPIVRSQPATPIVLVRTISPVSYANDLIELNVAPAEGIPPDRIELRVDGTVIAPAVQEAVMDQRTRTRYKYRRYPFLIDRGLIVRWDLQAYRGREARVVLSIAAGAQPQDIEWRRLALTSATSDLGPDGQVLVPDVPRGLRPMPGS
ncbi:MAG: NPCBM/NEW2 domain-containing protein [Pirellulales bacterium]|nr:NPCBM/NEW2 domain-containing protein [Pirellulales bacterium]